MTLITILNIVGCIGVIAAVVAPLAWAIRTEHRGQAPGTPARLMAKPELRPRPPHQPLGARAESRPAYETS